jgi:predicted  nucleic acid-binding Zn-ribbon protein
MAEQGMSGGPSQFGQQIAGMQENQNQESGDKGSNEYAQIAGFVSDLDRRLRVLEERYSNLRKKIQLTDQNLIESERSFGKELRGFNNDILEMKRNTSDFDEKVSIFAGELTNIAQKTDLKVVEKYLAMWNPSMFVTRKELREYLKNKSVTLGDSEEDNNSDDEQ